MTTDTTLDLLDIFSTNRESEEDGVWMNLHAVTDFKVRAFNAKAVSDLREKLVKPFQTMLRAGMKIPDDKNDEIGLRVLAGAVLTSWKGVKLPVGHDDPDIKAIIDAIPQGKIVANDDGTHRYNPDAAYGLLKVLPKLANQVAGYAMDAANYKDALAEENAGN